MSNLINLHSFYSGIYTAGKINTKMRYKIFSEVLLSDSLEMNYSIKSASVAQWLGFLLLDQKYGSRANHRMSTYLRVINK